MEVENTEKVVKYNNKKYYQNFKEKHKDEIKEKKICDVCGGKYTYFTKAVHIKSKKHKNNINKQENQEDIDIKHLIDDQIKNAKRIHDYLLSLKNK